MDRCTNDINKSSTLDNHKEESNKDTDKSKLEPAKSLDHSSIDFTKKQYEAKLQKITDLADRRHKGMQKLEAEIVKLKSQLEEKSTECSRIRQDYEKLHRQFIITRERRIERPESRNSDIEPLKRKIDDRTPDLKDFQSLLKPKPIVKSPIPARKIIKPEYIRKSMGDFDWIRRSDIVPTRKDAETAVKREDTITKRKRPSSKHARSISESTRPGSSRRIM